MTALAPAHITAESSDGSVGGLINAKPALGMYVMNVYENFCGECDLFRPDGVGL